MANEQKTPLIAGLNNFTDGRIDEANETLGRAVPAIVSAVDGTGTIVTVALQLQSRYTLPPVTCPVGFPEFIRFPIGPGTRGFIMAADYYMGGMSGLGGGTAKLTRQVNLATSIFFPVGNRGFFASPNPEATVIYGPDGVILTNEEQPMTARISIDGEGNVNVYSVKTLTTDCGGYGTKVTWNGGSSYEVLSYTAGVSVTTLPPNPPRIPT